MDLISKAKLFFCFFLIVLLLLSSAHSLGYNLNNESKEYDEDVRRSHFPDGFLFGTATSSYQIEGASSEDGKGLSNWDVFTHLSGVIDDGSNGDTGCDHYHHYLDDIEMMHSLGVNAYRFSISWARVLPRGRSGEVNPGGILFYNNIIDNLLMRGIEPFVTIHHDDFPQELEDRFGSWISPLMQQEFVHFAEICFSNFGDRVKYWTTINEPNVFALCGYRDGTIPPTHCSAPFGNCSVGNSESEPLIVVHNMLLAHAKAATLYRRQYQPTQGGKIGIVVSAMMFEPQTDEKYDLQAANRALAFDSVWMLDPLVHGDYPLEMRQYHGNQLPSFSSEEKAYVKNSIDFIGVNHYTTLYAKDCIHSDCTLQGYQAINGFVDTPGFRDGVPIGEPTQFTDFFVVPRGMEEIINYLKERYNNTPMFVTENGYPSKPEQNAQVPDLLNDIKRVQYHKSYLAALARSIRNGSDVRGYFVWSLMDNFEWSSGYSIRFGLYYFDHQTLQRIPKLSAKWYTDFLFNITLEDTERSNEILHKNRKVIATKSRDGMTRVL